MFSVDSDSDVRLSNANFFSLDNESSSGSRYWYCTDNETLVY